MIFVSRCEFGDCREVLRDQPARLADCCVTSPPYWRMRDYGAGQIGAETLGEYIITLVEVFRQVRRVLRDDGTLWLNLGDTYVQGGRGGGTGKSTLSGGRSGHASKDVPLRATAKACGLPYGNLVGVPWRVALALQDDGWYLRSDIIWHKPNAMPESVTSRPAKAHEYLFLLAKSKSYFYDASSIREPAHGGKTRNRRSVWSISTTPSRCETHSATYPEKLVEPCILAGSREGGVVLDPFFGSGTTGRVAERVGRKWLGIEIDLRNGVAP